MPSVIDRAEADDGDANITFTHADILKRALIKAGVEFIAENGGGAGVRLRKGEGLINPPQR